MYIYVESSTAWNAHRFHGDQMAEGYVRTLALAQGHPGNLGFEGTKRGSPENHLTSYSLPTSVLFNPFIFWKVLKCLAIRCSFFSGCSTAKDAFWCSKQIWNSWFAALLFSLYKVYFLKLSYVVLSKMIHLTLKITGSTYAAFLFYNNKSELLSLLLRRAVRQLTTPLTSEGRNTVKIRPLKILEPLFFS